MYDQNYVNQGSVFCLLFQLTKHSPLLKAHLDLNVQSWNTIYAERPNWVKF